MWELVVDDELEHASRVRNAEEGCGSGVCPFVRRVDCGRDENELRGRSCWVLVACARGERDSGQVEVVDVLEDFVNLERSEGGGTGGQGSEVVFSPGQTAMIALFENTNLV